MFMLMLLIVSVFQPCTALIQACWLLDDTYYSYIYDDVYNDLNFHSSRGRNVRNEYISWPGLIGCRASGLAVVPE